MMTRAFLIVVLTLAVLAGCGSEPTSVEELKKAGIDAFVQGDYATARTYLQRALHKAPSDRDLLYFTGSAFKRDYQYDSALVYLNRAAVLHKGDRDVAKQRLDVAMALEQWEIAQSCIRTLIDTGDPPEKHYLLQSELWRNRDWPINQYVYLQRHLDSHPNDSLNYLEFANVAVAVDSLAVAQRYLDTAIARFGDVPIYRAAKAVLYGAAGEFGRAERILRDLLKKDTASVDIKLNLANMLAEQRNLGKQWEALALYESVKPIVSARYPIDSLITLTRTRIDSLSN
ncbi:tetratricopeptide repeat protein [bacterium]|nr:tetratricopeptide repeat protein [bacterium]